MKKSLTLLFLVITVQVLAQTYPITGITISLPANADANTANWGSGAALLTITAASRLNNGRLDGRVQESKILVSIKKGGAKICGSYTSSSAPSANFNTLTKVWNGNNATSFLGQACTLLPGEYELTVQFFGAGAAGLVALSEEKTRPFSIKGEEQQAYQPPQAIAPANGVLLNETDLKKPITFRWTPVIPRPRETVTFRLRVWQLMQGQSGPQAMSANQPIITKDVDNITQTVIINLASGPCNPPYLCDFIWNVQALNREGKPIGGNNGSSEAWKITVQPLNDPPSIITLISPANGSSISTKDKPTFLWTFKAFGDNYSAGSNQLYKIKIVEIKGDQSPDAALRTNKPHFEKDSLKEQSFQYPSSATGFIAEKKYAWNVSIFDRWGNLTSSRTSMFIANSCDANLALKLTSVECLSSADGYNKYRICLSSSYTSSVYNLTYSNTGSGFKAYHPSYSPVYTASNITPALQVQNSGITTTVSYCFDLSVPSGQTSVKIGLQGDDKDPGPIVCQPGAELDVKLPNCISPICECGTWSPLIIENAAGTQRYDCGKEIIWNCKTSFDFKSSFLCKSNDKSCQAKIKWEVTKDRVPYKSGSGTNTISEGFTPNGNGTYVLTLNADCNGKACPPCTYTIIVRDCKDTSCDCGTWGPLFVQDAAGTQRHECGKEIVGSCNKKFDFRSTYQCAPNDDSCAAKTKWTVSKDGGSIATGSGLNGSFTPIANGVYTITLNAECNGKACPPCTYRVVVTNCPPLYNCVNPPTGMVAWWPLDEISGSTSIDLAGFNNSGTRINGPIPTTAKVLGGLQFDGINDYVEVPNHSELNFGTGDFSFDAWIKTTDNAAVLVNKKSGTGYVFLIKNGKLALHLSDGLLPFQSKQYDSPVFVADGNWHHIAITVSRANQNGILFYIDGIQTPFGTVPTQPGSITNTAALRIGMGSFASYDLSFNGILDEIELFNRVITQTEIVSIFKAGSAGKCKTSGNNPDTWTNKAQMPLERHYLGVGVVNGIVYGIGGRNSFGGILNEVEAYDPATNTWTTKAPMPSVLPLYGIGVGVVNGMIYVTGGEPYGGAAVATVWAYDPATNTWTPKASMPTARSFPGVSVVNGIIYAIGGAGVNFTLSAAVEAYDPTTNSWTTKASMPTARTGLGTGVVNGIIYAIGGSDINGFNLNAVRTYDPATNTWTTKASMPTARGFLGVGVLNGIIYAIGGRPYLATTQAYYPATNTWTNKPPMLMGRFGLDVGVVNGIIYAVGGLGTGLVLGHMEAYTP